MIPVAIEDALFDCRHDDDTHPNELQQRLRLAIEKALADARDEAIEEVAQTFDHDGSEYTSEQVGRRIRAMKKGA